MTSRKFWKEFMQLDLFPDRSTIGMALSVDLFELSQETQGAPQ